MKDYEIEWTFGGTTTVRAGSMREARERFRDNAARYMGRAVHNDPDPEIVSVFPIDALEEKRIRTA